MQIYTLLIKHTPQVKTLKPVENHDTFISDKPESDTLIFYY